MSNQKTHKRSRFSRIRITALTVTALLLLTLLPLSGCTNSSKSNPVASLYDGINGMLAMDSFNYSFTAKADGDSYKVKGYLSYGKNLDETVFYGKITGGETFEVGVYDGDVFLVNTNYGYGYKYNIEDMLEEAQDSIDDKIDYYEDFDEDYYLDRGWDEDEIEVQLDAIKSSIASLEQMREYFDIDFINSLFSGKHLNRDSIVNNLFNAVFLIAFSTPRAVVYPEGTKVKAGFDISKVWTTEAYKAVFNMFEAFVHDGLGNDKILNNIIDDLERSKDGSNTTTTFTVDIYSLIEEAFDYAIANYKKYPDIEKSWKSLLEYDEIYDEIDSELDYEADIEDLTDVLTVAKDLALGELAYELSHWRDGYDEAEVSVTVNKSGQLQEFKIEIGGIKLSLSLTNIGKADMDLDDLEDLADEADYLS